jgi:signal transduction histidine kinase/CheY-like chemotaxis protein
MTLRSKLIIFQVAVILVLAGVIAAISHDYFQRVHPRQLEGLATKAELCVRMLRGTADISLAAGDRAQLHRDLQLCSPTASRAEDDLRFIAIYDEAGQLLASRGRAPRAPPQMAPSRPGLVPADVGFRAGAAVTLEGKTLGSVWVEYGADRIAAGRRQLVLFAVLGLAFALLSAVVSVLFSFHLVRPLRRMIAFVHRVARGDLEARLETRAADELAVLVADLNWMTEELARSREQAIQSEKLAAFGQLAAGVAHEINNPSQFILTNLGHLRGQIARFAEQVGTMEGCAKRGETILLLQEMREIIDESALGFSRIINIVDNLRSFSHAGDRERVRFPLRDAVDPALRIARNEIRQRGQLVVSVPEELEVVGSPAQLSQVFLNLFVNAAQALGEASSRNVVEVRATDAGDAIEIAVSDTGSGIPPEHLGRIFDPFFSTKGREKGTGLGLTISRQIVADHGGELAVRSGVGEGTTFTVRLPRAPADLPAATLPDPPREQALARRARLLLVDDEPLILRSLQRVLGRTHEVVAVSSGTEALALIDPRAPFDLILCDLLMPAMSGMELYQRACAIDPTVDARFVFMSGNAFTEESSEFAAAMKGRILNKPFDAATVEQLLSVRLDAAA